MGYSALTTFSCKIITHVWLQPGVIKIRDKWYKTLPYCHQYHFGGKYAVIQLHRQIIPQNDGIPVRNY